MVFENFQILNAFSISDYRLKMSGSSLQSLYCFSLMVLSYLYDVFFSCDMWRQIYSSLNIKGRYRWNYEIVNITFTFSKLVV